MVRDAAAITKALDRAPDLPSLPTVVAKVHSSLADPRTSATSIGDIVQQDQALTARILRLVNSAFYGFPQKINSVNRAIVILGFNKVREVLLTASVFEAFKGQGDARFDAPGFWIHSLGTGIASQTVARQLKLPSVDDAFVAGLMHDLGKIVLAQHLKPEFEAVSARVAAEDCLMVEAEDAALGINHTAIGRALVERWNFPAALTAPIRFHHSPALAREHRDLVHAVHLGDILARALELGNGGDARIPAVDPAVWQAHNLSLPFMDRCMGETLEGFRKSQAFVDLFQGRGT